MLKFKTSHCMILILFFSVNIAIAQKDKDSTAFSSNMQFLIDYQKKVDFDALGNELTKYSTTNLRSVTVTWYPEEAWRISIIQEDFLDPNSEALLKALKPYILLFVLDCQTDEMGISTNCNSKLEIRNNIQVIDADGNRYLPLLDEEIPMTAKMIVSMLKPLFDELYGPRAEDVHAFLFPAVNEKDAYFTNPYKQGLFTVKLQENEFTWKLPLGPLFPPKFCPQDGEKLTGTWQYCPFHGHKLPDSNKTSLDMTEKN